MRNNTCISTCDRISCNRHSVASMFLTVQTTFLNRREQQKIVEALIKWKLPRKMNCVQISYIMAKPFKLWLKKQNIRNFNQHSTPHQTKGYQIITWWLADVEMNLQTRPEPAPAAPFSTVFYPFKNPRRWQTSLAKIRCYL